MTLENIAIGLGVDTHRLQEGIPLVLGGVSVPFEKGLAGHSDGDVLLHALMDAVLSAADAAPMETAATTVAVTATATSPSKS